MIRQVFIAGTDTAVGKTVITNLLARYLSERGYRATTQKWIETGCRKGKPERLRNPYIFKMPCSPHLAARVEKKKIRPDRIIKNFRALSGNFDFVVVEGIGGVLVPFSRRRMVIDIVQELKLPVLLVARNKLGAINHTLLAVEALNVRKIKILGIVFNNIGKVDAKVSKDNPVIIKALTKQKILGILPYSNQKAKLYRKFMPIGKKVLRQLTT